MLKESDDRVILGVTFDSKMTFEKHLHSVSKAASQRLGILRIPRGAVIAHWFTYAPPRCRTSQYRQTFIPLSVSLWNDLTDQVFDGVGLAGFKSMANAFLLG